MLNNQLISNLKALQGTLTVKEYKANPSMSPCVGGPTNCQNQWD